MADGAGRPLDGVLVLDFSQFLAGPVAALRLADLGARVIKIERPAGGDIGRRLAFAGQFADGDTITFHAMNRGKESFAANLKDSADLAEVRRLLARADVVVENFRPGVMDRLGLDYETVRAINPRIVYGSVTGYGDRGPWAAKPGQDLLAQAMSGLPWLNGSRDDPPISIGIAIADYIASCHLAHGITALLLRRERRGVGGRIETSLMEGLLDLQFELLSARLFDPSIEVRRGGPESAHAFLCAPYGIYRTKDGYLAIAMNSVSRLGELLGAPELAAYVDESSWWSEQAVIEGLLRDHLATGLTREWLDILEPADIWCAPVLTLPELMDHDGFATLGMVQETVRPATGAAPEVRLRTTRSPIRIDGATLTSPVGAPRLGADTDAIRREVSGDVDTTFPQEHLTGTPQEA
jgi:crotonobetainyl-CoA:carnitine CoA-transferase CaiB-like acyl-CoA transferase